MGTASCIDGYAYDASANNCVPLDYATCGAYAYWNGYACVPTVVNYTCPAGYYLSGSLCYPYYGYGYGYYYPGYYDPGYGYYPSYGDHYPGYGYYPGYYPYY
jgi:hypothetical protein